MKIWLDDVRPIPSNYSKEWIWIKHPDCAISLLKTGSIEEISFDHDLGENLDSMSVARFIEDEAYWNGQKPPRYSIHSQNPVGRANLSRVLENAVKLYEELHSSNVEII